MAEPVIISDNARNVRPLLSEEQWADLSLIAGRNVSSLCAKDDQGISLLVFPDSLDVNGDRIGDSTILDINDGAISTGNLMGFVGCHDTKLRIHSRFDNDENDYFLHYMLERVFSLNLFDLQYSTDHEAVFDFVLFLFPFFLNRALSQGLYKEYVTRSYNDSRVRGAIDVSRHIRLNIPFTGNIAYNTREHTADNDLIELVRHTIEYIRTKEFGHGILSRDEQTKENVALIIESTPRYEKRDRLSVINKNLRAKNHPYYTEYEPLRKLCIQILQQEELKYGKEDDTVYGILFDGAWLWEEYLNTLLSVYGFRHPENKMGKGAIHLFHHGRAPRYPDFYNESIVLDAKYKSYAEKLSEDDVRISGIAREDLAQVISYMYVLKLPFGGFLVPGGKTVLPKQEEINGYGGRMFLLNLPIPSGVSSYDDFCSKMSANEFIFSDEIERINKTD